MQINLKSSQQNVPLLSPIFEHTPMLSPLPEDTLRKYSYNYEEFANFKLESCEDEDYLLFEIQQVQLQHYPHENDCQEQPQLYRRQDKKPAIQIPCEPIQEQLSCSWQKQQAGQKKQNNQDSQKDSIQEGYNKDHKLTALENLIQYLIQHINQDQNLIKQQILSGFSDKQTYSQIITILVKKFKKTKKTKEEMVKYCMRKAFKYIADKMKKDRTHNRDIDSCMKNYFNKNQNQGPFSIPFKKNSTEKTMNGNFLKKVFSSASFVEDYKDFLHQFEALIEQDNYRKIKYLGEMIQEHLKNNQFKKIQTIKRLPWPQDTLDQTIQLSRTLIEYSDKDSPLCNLRRRAD